MQQKQGGKQKQRKQFHKQQKKRSQLENEEIEAIERALEEGAPPRGSNPLSLPPAAAQGQQSGEGGAPSNYAIAKRFDELPISEYSKQGLREAKYVTLTAVQRAALPHALCGRDVLGAAKTGSGKTLAFLLPVVEKLYRARWSKLDGLGALIISPTRELALQIFDELRKVGRRHDFSAGLLIGGKDVKEEQTRVQGMNILVCTPGRLLQHMDETPGFDASQLLLLVLDEADRILDMGFSVTLNAIVANIPRQRQTLLFSATQTKSVKDLARLSLKDPEYVSVHAEAAAPTPLRLQQAYMVCDLQQKVDILWSFIKTHLKAKTIIFVSTCKQVRFLFEAFRKLRPGVPLRALHGKMNQYKRMGVFYEFCEAKAMVLFATDIAARGLDFPTVDWVVQADCPEDVPAYIHRVGRTARYVSSGKGLLLLLPSEREGMLAQLEEAKVPVKQLKHNPAKVQPVTPALQALLSKDAELKEVAQRALVSYLRSVFLQPNRRVFDVTQLPAAEFASSMGLPTAPKLRFLKRVGKRVQEVAVGGGGPADAQTAAAGAPNGGAANGRQRQQAGAEAASGRWSGEESEGEGRREQRGAAAHAFARSDDGGGSDDDFLVVKRRLTHDDDGGGAEAQADALEAQPEAEGGKKKKKKPLKIKAHAVSGSRVVFDDEGQAVDPLALLAQDEAQFGGDFEEGGGGGAAPQEGLDTGIHASVAQRAAAARALMQQRDREDREQLRQLRKQQRQERRAKRLAREAADSGGAAVLAGGGESSGDESGASSSEAEDGAGGRGGRGAGTGSDSDSEAGGVDLDLLESSDDDGAAPPRRRRGGAPEAAHMGMLPARQEEAQPQERQQKRPAEGDGGRTEPQPAKRRRKQQSGGDGGGLSLEEQEALALRLLQSKR